MTDMRETLVIEGYASRFYKRDLAGDIVRPRAFERSLLRRGPGQIRMLFQHDASEPIGVWDQIIEDKIGLLVRGRLFADGPRGRTARSLVNRGSVDGLSIGFRTQKSEPIPGGRSLHEIDLWEVSIVTFPMLPSARLVVNRTRLPAMAGPLQHIQAG